MWFINENSNANKSNHCYILRTLLNGDHTSKNVAPFWKYPPLRIITNHKLFRTQTITINKVCGPEIKKENIKKNTKNTYQLREDDLWFINEERNKHERVRHHMRIAMQTNQTIVTYYITKRISHYKELCTQLEIPTSTNNHNHKFFRTQTVTINKVCGPEINKEY